jgi:hypothetical protein
MLWAPRKDLGTAPPRLLERRRRRRGKRRRVLQSDRRRRRRSGRLRSTSRNIRALRRISNRNAILDELEVPRFSICILSVFRLARWCGCYPQRCDYTDTIRSWLSLPACLRKGSARSATVPVLIWTRRSCGPLNQVSVPPLHSGRLRRRRGLVGKPSCCAARPAVRSTKESTERPRACPCAARMPVSSW